MKIAVHLCHVCHEDEPSLQAIINDSRYDCFSGDDIKISESYTHILRFDENGLSLSVNNADSSLSKVSPTRVDFLNASLEHRRLSSGKSQGIAKAVGLNKMVSPTVLDATAGLGKDSFILASLGCSVTMLERSPVVYALLKDGLRRGENSAGVEVRSILKAMKLINIDALSWFDKISGGEIEKPDVIYLDPMFPARNKSAKVKKDIFMLQQVLGTDEDFENLLTVARNCARHRVVVKRPGKASKNEKPKPSFQIEGKSAHFDVFV